MRLATIAWRGLLARPLRTALTTAGIALGVAVTMATIIVGSASEQALASATADLLGRADVRLRAFAEEGFGPRTLQSLRGLTGVEAAAPVSERRLTVSTTPGAGERVFTVLVLGIDPAVDDLVRDPALVAGVSVSADSPTDAVVPASWGSRNGVELGDELLLTGRRAGTRPLRIVGLAADTGLAAIEGGEVIIASRETLDAAFEVPSPVRYIDLDLGDDPTPADIEAVTSTLAEPFVVETPADAAARFASAQAGFGAVALLFGVVALVVGAFLVGNTLAMTVGERLRELGLLRAAGTTSRQALGIVVRQAAALGVGGSVLGVVAGIVLAAALIGLLSATRSVLVVGLPLPPGGILAAFGLGLVVTAIGAIPPAVRVARLGPLDALRPSQRSDRWLVDRVRPLVAAELIVVALGLLLVLVTGAELPILPAILSIGLLLGGAVAAAFLLEPLGRVVGRPFEWFFGAEGMLGRVNLARDRARTGLTIGAMMVALAAIVALGTVAESARAGSEARVASILPGGHAIRTSLPLEVDTFRETFDATRGVRVASPVLQAAVVRTTDAGPEEAALAGIDPNVFDDGDALLIRGADRADAFDALRAGGAVLVPTALAGRAGITVGDFVSLAVPGGEPQELAVAGMVEHSIPARTDDGALLVSAADARDRFGATTASLWIMVPDEGVAASSVAAAVRETAVLLAAEPLTARELASELSSSLERLVGLFDVLALVAVVIGALGIVNTLGVGIHERVREIAILRSHGMTVGQVQAMVVSEAAIMGAIAGVLAVVVGLLVAVALVRGSAATTELSAGLHLPWPLLVAVLLLGTGVAALAGLYPARVAASLPIVRNLKQFE
jgi:putative ABC transport system permease protein